MAPQITFNPDKDVPNLDGKVFFITGGTAGLGKGTILELAKHHPAQIDFTGRNKEAATAVIEEVQKISPATRVTFIECDLTSLASVNKAASLFLSTEPSRLDVLICNAGRMGGPTGLSQDGYEIQFAINYLSHALFTKRFLPLLERTAAEQGESRIINLSSDGYNLHTGSINFDDLKTTQENMGIAGWGGKWTRYGQSKFAQVCYSAELGKRYPTITTVAIHPGVVHTGLVNDLPFFDRIFVKATTLGKTIPFETGPYNTLWAATASKDNIKSGAVYYPVGRLTERAKPAQDEGLWKRLWEWTEEQLEYY